MVPRLLHLERHDARCRATGERPVRAVSSRFAERFCLAVLRRRRRARHERDGPEEHRADRDRRARGRQGRDVGRRHRAAGLADSHDSSPKQVSRMSGSSARRGFALPVAVITLVLLATLIDGVLFVATEELRAGRSDVAEERALAAAERAIDDAIAQWDPLRNTAMDVGTVVVAPAPAVSSGDRVDVTIARTQPRSLWIVARAESQDGRAIPARRAVAASLRLAGPSVPLAAALTAGGAVSVDDRSAVVGFGASPSPRHAQLCADAPPRSAAGVLAPDTTRVCGPTCGDVLTGVTGSPPVDQSIVAPEDSALGRFGGEPYATLATRAMLVVDGGSVVPRPVVADGVCDVTNPLNWGDPGGATGCRDHFPVILVRGSAVLAA